MYKRVAIAVAAIVGTTVAHGTEILSFGQSQAGTSPISATVSGATTTISAMDTPVTVTSCLLCLPITGPETFTFNATSIGPATTLADGFVTQRFMGSFSIMQGSDNILSGTFSDATFGAGNSLTLSVSHSFDSSSLNLTSNYIPSIDLSPGQAMSLSLADVTPAVAVTPSGTLAPFTGSIAGTFSAAYVPEPASLGLLLVGLGGLALRRRK